MIKKLFTGMILIGMVVVSISFLPLSVISQSANQTVVIRDKTYPARVATVDATGALKITGTPAVTQSGTWNVRVYDKDGTGIGSTSNALSVYVAGGITQDVAEGAAAGTTPALIGAQANSAEATAVDAGDAVKLRATVTGIPLTWGPALPGDTWEYSGLIEDTAWTAIKAGEANYYMCATVIYVQNSDTSVATVFTVYDDDDGDIGDSTRKWSGYEAAAGGGGKIGDGNAPIVCSTTAGNGLYFVAATTSSESRVTARGFRTKVAPKY